MGVSRNGGWGDGGAESDEAAKMRRGKGLGRTVAAAYGYYGYCLSSSAQTPCSGVEPVAGERIPAL